MGGGYSFRQFKTNFNNNKKEKKVGVGDVRFQSAGGHQLSDENDVLPLYQDHFPIVVEAYDIRMLKAFQHFRFLPETLPFALIQLLLLLIQKKKEKKIK